MSTSWRDRSAKVQVKETDLPSSIPPQTGLVFNIWYNKWSQGQSGQTRFVNPFRLDTNVHPGITLGDRQGTEFFCLYFAKGMCCLGKKCRYMHHVPEDEDALKLAAKTDVLDCFGREKFAFYRDDMGGVGSFRKRNRTLYVGGINAALANRSLKSVQIETRLRVLFSNLGELDKLRFVESKNCAFIKFKKQCNAEFAKEVISNQTLLIPSDKEWGDRLQMTGLMVKWANDDPDPRAQKAENEEQKQESINLMTHLLEKHKNELRSELFIGSSDNNPTKKSPSRIFSNEMLEKLRKRKVCVNENFEKRQRIAPQKTPLVDYPSSPEDE